jgi:hypothetical protein
MGRSMRKVRVRVRVRVRVSRKRMVVVFGGKSIIGRSRHGRIQCVDVNRPVKV